jgi:2Fe-2S thioredoxin-like protein
VTKPSHTLNAAVTNHFEVEGEFRGFFRDMLGKHRMALEANSGECYLKVPKRLRKTLCTALAPGQRIVARVVVKLDRKTGEERHIVAQIRLADGALLSCPIRICVKKNCWRNGGKQLWHALKEDIAEAGLEEDVRLKAVNCLGHCERGPNAECAGRLFHHCTPSDAKKILEPFLP